MTILRILSLNLWCGTRFTELMDYIVEHAQKIDVFCFQEVFSTDTDRTESNGARVNLYQELQRALPGFQGWFAHSQKNIDLKGGVGFSMATGNALFVKKDVTEYNIGKYAERFVYGTKDWLRAKEFDYYIKDRQKSVPRNVQSITLHVDKDQRPCTIYNFHGLWNGQGKGDSPDRIKQSFALRDFIKPWEPGAKILIGDFNYLPGNLSLGILEEWMRNLITEFGIKTTRSSHYTKPEKFADYALVTNNIGVQYFTVPTSIQVSDHLPLFLTVQI